MPPHSVNEARRLAINLARNTDYSLFPCREDKTPATRNGFRDASNDPERIDHSWKVSPGPLIGIATGEASGVDVLDVDSGKHPEAEAWWRAATSGDIRPSVLPTRVYRTRSGGLHAYFQHARGVVNTQSKLARGVDTRGCGGYAIYWFAAGCPCEDEAPPSPWPAWLLSALLW
jgi:Bifunctional DNA primase/polymerase, N-terminal